MGKPKSNVDLWLGSNVGRNEEPVPGVRLFVVPFGLGLGPWVFEIDPFSVARDNSLSISRSCAKISESFDHKAHY